MEQHYDQRESLHALKKNKTSVSDSAPIHCSVSMIAIEALLAEMNHEASKTAYTDYDEGYSHGTSKWAKELFEIVKPNV